MKDKIFFLFFPVSYTRAYIQSGSAVAIALILFFLQNAKIENQLHEKPVEGTITEILVGSKGGGVGKYSGRSTYYNFRLKEYNRNFLLEDASIFENWQFDRDDFAVGDKASFRVIEADLNNLNVPTTYAPAGRTRTMWPQENSSTKIFGITINGKEILSAGASVRGLTYNTWFWLFIPLFIYAIASLFITTGGFQHWSEKAEFKT